LLHCITGNGYPGFFLPLQSARKAMLASRNRLLKAISLEFDVTFSSLQPLHLKTPEEIELLLKRHRQVEELHKSVNSFPVWPFNLANLRRFFSLVIIPILPGLVSIVGDLLNRE
jgi:hypothetical protein